MIETLYAVAGQPERWEQLVDALDVDASPEDPRAAEAVRLAHLSAEPIEGRESARTGVILIGPSGGALACNAGGEAVFHQRLGLIEAQGLKFFNPSNHEALSEARRRLQTGGAQQVIVKFAQSNDEAPHFAYVIPANRLPPALARELPEAGAGGVAVLFPAVETTDRLWASVRESFGLTPAETRLAARLKEGLTLKEASAELGVTLNTVRNQLRSVFDKMGLNRQSELVRALTQLGSLSGALDPPSHAIAATERGALETAPPQRFFSLADGRRLAWRDYGAPGGRVVLIIHQGLGCSLLPRGFHLLANDLGLRLICPERPGVGRSDPHPNFSYESVGRDMAELVHSLGAPEVQIVSFMSGAAFGLMTAAELGPMASRILLASARPSGVTSESERDAPHRTVLFRRRITRNAWLADAIFAVMRTRLKRSAVERYVRAAASSPSDAAYLEAQPEVMDYVIDYISESLAMTSRGIADEVKCSARNPQLDLSRLSARITIWHGEEDPISRADEVVAWVGGRTNDVRVFANSGHFMPHKHWPDILGWLAAD